MKFQSSSNSKGAPNRLSSKAWALVNAKGLLAQAGFPRPSDFMSDSATIKQTDYRGVGWAPKHQKVWAMHGKTYLTLIAHHNICARWILSITSIWLLCKSPEPEFLHTTATRRFWDWDSGQSSAKRCNASGPLWSIYLGHLSTIKSMIWFSNSLVR